MLIKNHFFVLVAKNSDIYELECQGCGQTIKMPKKDYLSNSLLTEVALVTKLDICPKPLNLGTVEKFRLIESVA